MGRTLVLKQNCLPYSEDMSKFTASSLNLGAKVKNPINGAVTADVLVPTVGNAQHYCYSAVPSNPILIAGGVATYSAIFKTYGWNWIRLQLAVAGGNVMAYFNIANGTVGTLVDGGQQILSADIKPFENPYDPGWYEVSFTVKAASNKIFGEAYFLVTDTDNTNFFVGDGVKGIAVFASQLTGVNWRGDYQPTNGSPVLNPIRDIIKKQNLVNFSSDLTKASTFGIGSITDSGVGPNNEPNACDRITDTAINGPHYVSQSVTGKGTGIYTAMAIVRPIAGCSFSIVTSDSVSGAGIVVDGTTGQYVATTSTGGNCSLLGYLINPLSNGLLMVTITVNYTALAPVSLSIPINQAKVTTWGWAYTGSSNAIEVYHLQMVKANWSGDLAFTNGTALTNPIRNIVQKQNLLLHSENAAGLTSNPAYITVASNVEVAPNNTVTMDTITDTAVNTGHYISQTTGTIVPGVFCFSAYIKPIAGCSFSIVAGGTVADGIGILVDGSTLQYISTHTTGTGFTLLDYKIQAVPNGSYRVSITFSHSKTQLLLIVATNKAKTNTWGWAYVGTGDSIGVWGMQFVQANWAGDYQVTTTAQVNNPIRNIVQKQNLLSNSSDLTTWPKAGVFTVTGGELDPEGNSTAFKMTSNIVNPVIRAVGRLAKRGAIYTASVWLRTDTPFSTYLEYLDANDGDPPYQKKISVTTEWKRYDVTSAPLPATASLDNMNVFIGDRFSTWPIGNSLYIWQPQLTESNVAGDLVKTTGTVIDNPIRNTI